jgi:hypothetical protein
MSNSQKKKARQAANRKAALANDVSATVKDPQPASTDQVDTTKASDKPESSLDFAVMTKGSDKDSHEPESAKLTDATPTPLADAEGDDWGFNDTETSAADNSRTKPTMDETADSNVPSKEGSSADASSAAQITPEANLEGAFTAVSLFSLPGRATF